MHATIADVRRGDRFTRLTGRGGTYIALRAAKPARGLESKKARVMVVDDANDQVSPDGTIDLGSVEDRRAHMIDPAPDTPVEIHERGLHILRRGEVIESNQYSDELNLHLGATDRESAARRLRSWIPEVVARIDDLGSERDLLIRQGLAAGIPAPELAALSGLSRSRIYQIKDGKR